MKNENTADTAPAAAAPAADKADTTSDTGTEPAIAAKDGKFQVIDLAEPITRGDKTFDKLTLRKPKAGELRGLSLTDCIGLEISALLKLIPRISDPVLTDDECQNLDPADFTEIGGAIRGFFMTKAERQMLDKMLAEQQPKT